MNFEELVWFAGQINAQKWRFFYARMSIKSRLERLEVQSPPARLSSKGESIAQKLEQFQQMFSKLSVL